MLKWLETLNKEIEGVCVETIKESDSEIEEGETVAGDVSIDHQKLFTLTRKYHRLADKKLIAMKFAQNKEAGQEHEAELLMAKARAEILMQIFWASLKDEFQLWDKESVGFRKGWKVTWKDEDL